MDHRFSPQFELFMLAVMLAWFVGYILVRAYS